MSHLRSLLEVLDAVPVDIMVRSDRLLELVRDDHTRSFRRRTARKQHDPRSRVRERALQETDRHAHRHARASLGALVVRYGPWIPLELLEDRGKLRLDLSHWEQEARCGGGRRPALRRTHVGRPVLEGSEVEHVLDLLRSVLFRPPEDVGFRAVGIPELVNVGLSQSAKGMLGAFLR